MMSVQSRIVLLAAAVIAIIGAVALVIGAGLPARAAYTGWTIPGQSRPVAPEIDGLAPPFERWTIDGRRVDLWALRGSPVVINFWATWCAPCRVEMPELQHLYEEYQKDGLHILAVNLAESPNHVREWVSSLGLTFDVLLDDDEAVAALYWLRGVPSTFVVSPEGVITRIFYGPVTMSELRAALVPYLR